MHVESVDAEASLVAASIAFERAGRGLALLAGDGRILRLNAAFAALHDSDPAALLHRPISDPLPGYEPAENVDTTVVLTDPAAELFLRRTAIGTDSALRYRLTALPGTGESSGNAQLLAEVWLDRGPQLAKGPIAEALVEADSTIVAANPAMQRLLGRADTLVGQRLTHLA